MSAAGVFGIILVGSREALEGDHTFESLLAMALIGIRPDEGGQIVRRASMSDAGKPAVQRFRGDDEAPFIKVDFPLHQQRHGSGHGSSRGATVTPQLSPECNPHTSDPAAGAMFSVGDTQPTAQHTTTSWGVTSTCSCPHCGGMPLVEPELPSPGGFHTPHERNLSTTGNPVASLYSPGPTNALGRLACTSGHPGGLRTTSSVAARSLADSGVRHPHHSSVDLYQIRQQQQRQYRASLVQGTASSCVVTATGAEGIADMTLPGALESQVSPVYTIQEAAVRAGAPAGSISECTSGDTSAAPTTAVSTGENALLARTVLGPPAFDNASAVATLLAATQQNPVLLQHVFQALLSQIVAQPAPADAVTPSRAGDSAAISALTASSDRLRLA